MADYTNFNISQDLFYYNTQTTPYYNKPLLRIIVLQQEVADITFERSGSATLIDGPTIRYYVCKYGG